ncbi:GNAT family N-acetyltransferase [Arthrobacter sp. 35W]|uniref:GNAT family N-acetyltransferase n=1 Tax=Arthrobacter sp. 35W TaxID=1132441 RepID=UPI0004269BE2|nr:GNAT family protein [Arthrobacter sp. 35W]
MQHNISLSGHGVRLVPLRRRHAGELFGFIDSELWAGMASEQPVSKRALERLFAARIANPTTLSFAVIEEETGVLMGTTSFYDYSAEQSRVEIGMTFFGRQFWGTRVNAASKHLLMNFAFEQLRVHRITMRCDARNVRSAAAILKLGATPEGVLRGYRVAPDGTRADTSIFSILTDEWPLVHTRLLDRLAGGLGTAAGLEAQHTKPALV